MRDFVEGSAKIENESVNLFDVALVKLSRNVLKCGGELRVTRMSGPKTVLCVGENVVCAKVIRNVFASYVLKNLARNRR